MSECINKFYIENNKVMECNTFDDRVFTQGISIYEVIRIINGVPLFLEEHIKRFKNSCNLEGKEMLLQESEMKNSIKELLQANNVFFGNVKLVFNYDDKANKSILYFLKHSYPEENLYQSGVNTVLFFGERNNPNAKVINSSFRSNVEKLIKEKNAYEAILVDNSGFVTEGSKSNIFMVQDNKVITSPLEMVLPGVTRGIIIDIIKEKGISFEEKKINYKDIKKLSGLFITGTSPKVLPIKAVDEDLFNSSSNEIILKIRKEYDDRVRKYIEQEKKR